jgi:hypothetical protein
MNLRHLEPADFDVISPALDEWWGGRPVQELLPRLFFEHFQPTSLNREQRSGALCRPCGSENFEPSRHVYPPGDLR